jgi:hypothetical protein
MKDGISLCSLGMLANFMMGLNYGFRVPILGPEIAGGASVQAQAWGHVSTKAWRYYLDHKLPRCQARHFIVIAIHSQIFLNLRTSHKRLFLITAWREVGPDAALKSLQSRLVSSWRVVSDYQTFVKPSELFAARHRKKECGAIQNRANVKGIKITRKADQGRRGPLPWW